MSSPPGDVDAVARPGGRRGVRTTRVLMVTGAYHPELSSSAIQCRDVARLIAGRATVRVLTTAVDAGLPARDRVDDVEVARVRVDVSRAASRAAAALRMMAALVRLLPESDVVHIHGVSAKNTLVTAAARLFGRPVVLSLHTAGHDDAREIRRKGRAAWWAFARADRYLAVSPALADACLDAGVSAARVQLVPNGIDTVRFAPADEAERRSLRQRLGLPHDRPVVLFVGFFSHDKQPQVLLDAWLRARAAGAGSPVLVFVGATQSAYFEVDDSLAGTMRRAAAAAGAADDLVFAGPTHDVQDYFRAADLFVLPSRREGLPVALLEAMACGLPCIASRLPGSTDAVVDDGVNGWLVPPGDVDALGQGLARALGDPVQARALGQEARRTVVERFTNVTTAEQWLAAYERMMERRA